jgi:hypothetical protein
MTDWDWQTYYLWGVGLVFGTLYTLALTSYLRLVQTRTGARFPLIGSGVLWYMARPRLLLRGIQRMREVQYAQSDPELEAARRMYSERRTWIFAGVAASVIVLTALTFGRI